MLNISLIPKKISFLHYPLIVWVKNSATSILPGFLFLSLSDRRNPALLHSRAFLFCDGDNLIKVSPPLLHSLSLALVFFVCLSHQNHNKDLLPHVYPPQRQSARMIHISPIHLSINLFIAMKNKRQTSL